MDEATTVAHRPEHTLERLIFFTDTVFAAAIELGRARNTAVILGAGSAMIVSLVAPMVGQVTLATIPLWRLLLLRVGRRGRAVSAR